MQGGIKKCIPYKLSFGNWTAKSLGTPARRGNCQFNTQMVSQFIV